MGRQGRRIGRGESASERTMAGTDPDRGVERAVANVRRPVNHLPQTSVLGRCRVWGRSNKMLAIPFNPT